MRDFYDVYEIITKNKVEFDKVILAEAFSATCVKRRTIFSALQMEETLKGITEDTGLPKLWELYRKDNFYVGDIEWTLVCEAVCAYIMKYLVKEA